MIIVKVNRIGTRDQTHRMADQVLKVCRRLLVDPEEVTEVTKYEEECKVYLSFSPNIDQKSLADAIAEELPVWEVRVF